MVGGGGEEVMGEEGVVGEGGERVEEGVGGEGVDGVDVGGGGG